jgi:hypothetical protein
MPTKPPSAELMAPRASFKPMERIVTVALLPVSASVARKPDAAQTPAA